MKTPLLKITKEMNDLTSFEFVLVMSIMYVALLGFAYLLYLTKKIK